MAMLQNALKNLRSAADRRAGQLDDRSKIDGPSAELQALFDKLGHKARDGARGDSAANNEIDNNIVPAIHDAWKRLDAAANASTIAPIQEIENLIDVRSNHNENHDNNIKTKHVCSCHF